MEVFMHYDIQYSYMNSISPFERDIKDCSTIAVDVDGVIARTRDFFIGKIEDDYDVSVSEKQRSLTNPEIKDGLRYGQVVKNMVGKDMSIFKDIKPIPGALKSLRLLSMQYNILIVTNRVKEGGWFPDRLDKLRDVTVEWLNNNNFTYNKFVFPLEEKAAANAGIYIDDRLPEIRKLDKQNSLPILFSRRYNTGNKQNAWTAAEYDNSTEMSMSRNLNHQWSIITEALRLSHSY
jgi:5'(3')-deoxyribonucleotidase